MLALASPASLKGVLSPLEAAMLLASGMRRVDGLEVDEAPVADGGEGTAEVLHRSLGGTWQSAAVSDPLGRATSARWLQLPDGTAVVEAAEPIGLPHLRADELDPVRASSRGLGELLLAVVATRPRALLACVGGTATVDGGAGMRAVVGGWLKDVPIRVACDVRNPLLGERGAARVFGPQKGADPEMVEELEARLAAMSELALYRDLPGAGAGGGLGAAFAALGGELLAGAELVLDLIGFDERARDAARRRDRRGNRRRDDARGKGARCGAPALRAARGALRAVRRRSCGTASRRTRSRAAARSSVKTSCSSARSSR